MAAGGVVAAAVVLALLELFLGAWESVPVDRIGLHGTGGPIEGEESLGVVEPGSGARVLGCSTDSCSCRSPSATTSVHTRSGPTRS